MSDAILEQLVRESAHKDSDTIIAMLEEALRQKEVGCIR